ncbi:MAG: ribosome biogenesis GTP-binding protein YihA/YsxC [Tissierellia bacterium]|nr:ribosome biogenesis GTP-binding protein YihA/YsxC [Tissierellia bacterium]
MKIKHVELEKIGATVEQYPPSNLPEIAFAGRSNVGKSSLINALVGRKNIAHTSSKPGKTRTVNFYCVNQSFRFVDLPGYGYAIASKKEKAKWHQIIDTYLHHRNNLYEVVLVVDIRHEPTKQDIEMYQWILEIGFTGFVVATKLDKISRGKRQKNIGILQRTLGIDDGDLIFPFSSTSKENRDLLLEQVDHIIKYGSGFDEE